MDEAKDSVTCLCVTDHEILSGSADGRIRRYDLRMGQIQSDFIGSKCSLFCLFPLICFSRSNNHANIILMMKPFLF